MSTPPASSQDYFNSSKLKVIGLITAATVVVGALGGIAGVVFDPDATQGGGIVQPGTGGQTRTPTELTVGAPSTTHQSGAARFSSSAGLALDELAPPRPLATTIPSPVGTASPGDDFSSSPSPSSSTDAPDDSGTTTGGSSVTLSATGAQVYVPDGWDVNHSDDTQMAMGDGTGDFAFAFSITTDPSTAAGDVITANLDALLPTDSYTQLKTSDVAPLEAFGSVVSLAGMEYEALWVDDQGSASIHGQLYVGVRQDGTVLGIMIEHIPAEDFDDSFDTALVPILDNSFGRFAGTEG